jgi:hypothetical protein
VSVAISWISTADPALGLGIDGDGDNLCFITRGRGIDDHTVDMTRTQSTVVATVTTGRGER